MQTGREGGGSGKVRTIKGETLLNCMLQRQTPKAEKVAGFSRGGKSIHILYFSRSLDICTKRESGKGTSSDSTTLLEKERKGTSFEMYSKH